MARVEYDPETGVEIVTQQGGVVQGPPIKGRVEPADDDEQDSEVVVLRRHLIEVNGADAGCSCEACTDNRVDAMTEWANLRRDVDKMGRMLSQVSCAYNDCRSSEEVETFRRASDAVDNLLSELGREYDGSDWKTEFGQDEEG